MSTVTPKTVDLSVTVGGVSDYETGTDVASEAEVTPLSASIIQLSDAITAIASDQKYLKMREEAHRNSAYLQCMAVVLGSLFTNFLANESTNSRVLWWSFFEMMALLSMSIWQIYYLRR